MRGAGAGAAIVERVVTAAFALAEHSALFRARVFQPVTQAFVRHAIAAWQREGVGGWSRWHLPIVRAVGRGRARHLRARMRMDVDRADHLARVHAYEDPLLGVTGHDADSDADRAVRVETACPLGDIAREARCPDLCRVLIHAFETETLVTLNPRYVLEPLTELLSAGDAQCTFVHRIERPRGAGGNPDAGLAPSPHDASER
jgi:hypothetical protein